MGRRCPLGGYVLYLDCLECDDKVCKRSDNMVKYIETKKGYKYVPTEKANERIKAKYDEVANPRIAKQYKYNVPEQWVEQGYVEQVEEVE